MKSKRKVKRGLFILFIGEVFCSQFIALTIINNMGAFEKQTMWCVLLTSLVLTILFCAESLIMRALYYRLSGKSAEEKEIENEFYELLCGNK